MADLSSNHNLEEYSESSTTVAFDRPLPLLRGPVRSSPSGPFVLAFRDAAAWKTAFRACESRIADQCDAVARISCAMTASSKCKPPWWRNLAGPDFRERERCEEREMEGCLAVAKEKCSGFATEKCRRSFVEARVSARAKSGVADIVSLSTVMDRSFWSDLIGLNRLGREFGETSYKASELIGRNSEIDCVLGGFSKKQEF